MEHLKTYLENEINVEGLKRLYDEMTMYDGSFEQVLDMDLLDDYLHGLDMLQVLRMAYYGKFNPNHDYFIFNDYGHLESMNSRDYDNHIEYLKYDIIERALEMHAESKIDILEILDIDIQ